MLLEGCCDYMEEFFEIVDDNDHVIGTASRSQCHGDPSLVHRTSHVVVRHPDGRILLQKRSEDKDIQPGKWDTAVGGHLEPGEDYEAAARREMNEELGIPESHKLKHEFDTKIRNEIESENTRVFSTIYSGTYSLKGDEIDEVRFWTQDELKEKVETDDPSFTPNVKIELKRLLNL